MVRLAQSLVFSSALLTLALAQGTTLTTNPESTCATSAKCFLKYPSGITLLWSSFSPTSTIVHATVRYIVNNATNSTTTTTIFNTLPAGVEAPPTNDAGTRIVTLTSFAATGGETVVAYPTGWADYDSLVPWSGTISTKGTCRTENEPATITLPPHPPVPSSLLYTNSELSTDEADPTGYFYSPFIEGWMAPIASYADKIDEAVLSECDRSFQLPPTALQGVRFLTETETSFSDGGGPASTSTPESTSAPPSSNPPPTSTPPPPPPTSTPPPPTSAPPQPTSNPPQSSRTTPAPVEDPSQDTTTGPPNPPPPPQSTGGPDNQSPPNQPEAPVTTGNPSPSQNPNPNPNSNPNPNPNPDSPTEQPPPSSAPVLNIGDNTITGAPEGSTFVIGGQTLTPGGTITVEGTTVELNPTAPVVVINGESSTLSSVRVSPTATPTGTGTEEEPPEFTGAAAGNTIEAVVVAVFVVGVVAQFG